jgi:phosphopantothenoylcysteine decarboxylase / phosphopantothenate---cysteine ligase
MTDGTSPREPKLQERKQPLRVLITAGPTYEPIDAVRFIGNRSSGRMGIALARACAHHGLMPTLLLGPVDDAVVDSLGSAAADVALHRFHTTDELAALLALHWPEHDVLIMAAAVADFRPRIREAGKRKRADGPISLELEPTPDLLAMTAESSRPEQRRIGFALEPADTLERAALAKLERKGLDAIVANPLSTMDSANVTATVFRKDGTTLRPPPDSTKQHFAEWLIDHLPMIVELPAATPSDRASR